MLVRGDTEQGAGRAGTAVVLSAVIPDAAQRRSGGGEPGIGEFRVDLTGTVCSLWRVLGPRLRGDDSGGKS
ncbi:hypothetical protein SIAM614_04005 [Roseibium aggregatum IAM 12614]|uniref:Uncharacterized protein n=1 Tax=Roseibium aggregatum (strain ATCC 25650 / DSM 13394 / JCM 20685 / NBRC 16684 / NCIMB 2208 / IAM 12614 / B1) TaxID=384765 RepID=A0NRW4_ROSAI|nr:hypothetical protein SIAM614_04005 [Roseibium aggregatum IAM 12614]